MIIAAIALGIFAGAGVMYAVLLARSAAEVCETASDDLEETSQSVAHAQMRMAKFETRLFAQEQTLHALCKSTGVKKYQTPAEKNGTDGE